MEMPMASASEATEWNELSTRYFLEAALRATRNSDLYLVVLDCAARHPGAAAQLAARAPDSDAGRNTPEILAAYTEFFARLVQFAAGSDAEVPALRGNDVAGWMAGLTNYMNLNGTATHPPRDGATAARRVAQFGRAYFAFMGELTRAAVQAEERRLRRMLEGFESLRHPEPMIRLRAAVGEVTAAEFLVQNTRAEPARVSCRMPSLRSANGAGAAFAPGVVIRPNDFMLDPEQEARVLLSLEVAAGNFEPATSYVGDLHLRRGEEPEVRIPLRLETAGRLVVS